MTTENLELDQMKNQIGLLKAKLDQQTIISEKMIYASIKEKTKRFNTFLVLELCIVPVFLLLGLPFTMRGVFSWYLFAFTFVMLTGSVIADFCINKFKRNELLDKNLVAASKARLLKMKQNRKVQFLIECPILVIWFGWYFIERRGDSFDNWDRTISLIVAFVIVLIISTAISISMYRSMQKTNDEIIEQLDELSKE